MLIAQITDCHISSEGAPEGLARVAAAVNALDPMPELILATGDLANEGDRAEYRALRAGLAAFEAPVFLLPGNHDRREGLKAEFPDHAYLPDGPFLHYTIEDWPLRIIAVDTVKPGSHGAEQCAARLDWLAARLDEAPGRPTLVAMHHPPFRSGFYRFDHLGFDGLNALQALMGARPQIQKIICGHLHRAMEAQVEGIAMVTAPSTAYGFTFTLGEEPIARVDEPPAFMLHHYRDGQGIASYSVATV